MKITDSSYKDYKEGAFKDPVDYREREDEDPVKPTEIEQKEQAIAGAIHRLLKTENALFGDKPITNIQVRLFLNVQNQWIATASGKMTFTICS